MVRHRFSARSWIFAIVVGGLSAFAGCFVGYHHETEHWSDVDTALGEEHIVAFSRDDATQLAEDALRGDGLLYEVQPDGSIVTLWRDADPHTPAGGFSLIVGQSPRYRYEIRVVALGSHQSKVIVNVRTESIPDADLNSYKASNRFAFFKEIDELGQKYPPATGMPTSGGVNFTLLPNENLAALAKRVTGNENNWQAIARDNGFNSVSDVTPFESVWVRNSLLPVPSKH
ncbi:MAG: hypothetical protein IVW56_13385 [Candidatus Binataceae bacterium]|nr:hypothetical protein [Candidatus Binataceae bacterium]